MFRNVFKVRKILRFYAATTRNSVSVNVIPNFDAIKRPVILCSAVASVPFVFDVNNVVNYYKNDNENQKLFLAAKSGDTKSILKVLHENKNVDINMRHSCGWTLLLAAVVNGHLDTCRELLKAGANPNLADEFSDKNQVAKQLKITPFQVIKIRETEFCDKLTTSINYSGFTPLHYAVVNEDFDIIKLLIEYGANPNLVNNMYHSSMDYANDDTMRDFMVECSERYKVLQKERNLEERRRFPLEMRLKQHIVGQEVAISIVSSTIRRKENGWTDEKHPLVFLFLGSSGIGKTELAKQLANYIHKDNRNGFIRLDMSEYQEKHEVAKLIGAPPGYVGHEEGGQLTKLLKQCKNAVVLFDEVDKAHPDVLTVLLQLFDEGRLTDGKGKTIECTDAIFIMTSNLASDEIAQHGLELRDEACKVMNLQKSNSNQDEPIEISRNFKDKVVKPILKRHFRRDEFLGRINEIIYFLPFSKNELLELVRKELEIWEKRALEKHNITLKWDQKVEAFLTNGYDVNYGARSIKYEVDRRLVNLLAEKYEMGDIRDKSVVEIGLNSNQTNIVLKINNSNDDNNGTNGFLKNIGGFFTKV